MTIKTDVLKECGISCSDCQYNKCKKITTNKIKDLIKNEIEELNKQEDILKQQLKLVKKSLKIGLMYQYDINKVQAQRYALTKIIKLIGRPFKKSSTKKETEEKRNEN